MNERTQNIVFAVVILSVTALVLLAGLVMLACLIMGLKEGYEQRNEQRGRAAVGRHAAGPMPEVRLGEAGWRYPT